MKPVLGIALTILVSFILASCQSNPGGYRAAATPVNPKAAKWNRRLAIKYLKQKDIATAKQKLNLALAQDPNSPRVMDTAAYFYEHTGDNKRADEYFQKAIELAPSVARYHNNYGVFLCQQKQYRFAIDQFIMAATDRQYTHPDAAYENAGLCAQKMKNPQLAAEYYQEALRINPKHPNALLELGQMSYDSHHYKQANRYLARYNKQAASTAESLWLGVRVNQKLGDSSMAANYATLLVARFPKAKETELLNSQNRKKVT